MCTFKGRCVNFVTREQKLKNEATRLAREQRLIEKLRKRPQLLERLEAIMGISEAEGEKVATADEIEERLMAEIRRLGSEVMGQWAENAEARVSPELEQRQTGVGVRKNSPAVVVCVWAD